MFLCIATFFLLQFAAEAQQRPASDMSSTVDQHGTRSLKRLPGACEKHMPALGSACDVERREVTG